jgi:putative PEP-CTERM system TPR-repeat lipoprotein
MARKAGDRNAAIDYLQKAVTARPDVIAPGLRLVNLFITGNDGAKALSEANVLLQNHPDDPQVLEIMGRAQMAAGEKASAVQSFRRLAGILPKSGQAQFLLGTALRASGDTDGARDAYEKAIQLTPDFGPSYQGLMAMEAQSGNLDGALDLAGDLQKSLPDSPAGFVFAGDINLMQKKPKEAIAAFETAWKKRQVFPIAARLYEAHAKAGDAPAGLAVLKQWVDGNPADMQAKTFLANAYLETAHYKEAIVLYEAMQPANEKNVLLLNNLAWLYQQTGDKRDVETARKAYDLQPGSPVIADTYGWILASSGKSADALPILQKAAAMAPGNTDIRYHFASALVDNKKPDEARRELEAILGMDANPASTKKVRDLLQTLK